MIIAYLHGFQTSSKARKATILAKETEKLSPDTPVLSLDFPDDIKLAYFSLCQFVENVKDRGQEVCLVGSSLGGFLALLLSIKYNVKAALVNPCLTPYDFCRENNLIKVPLKNFDTGNEFMVTDDVVTFLKEKEKTLIHYRKDKTIVFLQKGDEVLDYNIALNFFKDLNVSVEDGGSHTYENFESKVPVILDFFKKS